MSDALSPTYRLKPENRERKEKEGFFPFKLLAGWIDLLSVSGARFLCT